MRLKTFTLSFLFLISFSIQTLADVINYSKAIEILGVSEQSSPEEVTKAYRKLAMKLHPDRIGNDSREEDFKTMKEAYEFLVEINFKKENDTGRGSNNHWQHENSDPEREEYKQNITDYELKRKKAAEEAQKGYTFDIDSTLGMHGHFFNGAKDIISMLSLRMEQNNITPDLAFLVYTQTVMKYGLDEILKLYMLYEDLKMIQELVFETIGEMPITAGIDRIINLNLRSITQSKTGSTELKAALNNLTNHYGLLKLASNETKLKLASALKVHQIEWPDVLTADPSIQSRILSRRISSKTLGPSCEHLLTLL